MPIIPSVGGATRMTSILQGRSGLGTDHIPTKHQPQLLHHYTRLALMSLTQLELPSWSWPWQLTWLAALAKSQRQERPTTAHWCSCPFASLGLSPRMCCFSKCLDHINGATSHAAYWQLLNAMKNTTPVIVIAACRLSRLSRGSMDPPLRRQPGISGRFVLEYCGGWLRITYLFFLPKWLKIKDRYAFWQFRKLFLLPSTVETAVGNSGFI